MSLKLKIKNRLKAVVKTYAELKGDSRKIEFGENLGDGLVFATGFDKSGTTWLMNILDYHPEIVCRGSGQIFNFYRENVHFIGDPGGYGVFVNNIINSRWYQMNGGKVWFDPTVIEANARNFIAASFQKYADGDHKFVGDKSTVQDVELIRKLFPNSKIVCMVRDARDVAVSFAFHFKRGGKTNKFNADGAFQQDYLQNVARAWSLYSEHIRKNLSDKNLHIVKYEELLNEPKRVISEIYSFMGVKQDDNLLESIMSKTSFESQSGGRAPGQEDQKSYFRKGIAGDWLNYFGEPEKKILKEIAGDELIQWGYESNSNW